MTNAAAVLTGPVAGERSVRVASVPADHPYVRRVSAASGITVLPDPEVAGAPPGTWWPPAILDPGWIRAHAHAADLLHIHFGTESFPPGHLTTCVDAAHDAGWPVVYTVHDLDHPQLQEQVAYLAQLDELVPRADAVITLTAGAAEVIRQRWGREAEVIPHPSLRDAGSDLRAIFTSAAVPAEVRVGAFLKDLRPNVDGPGTVAAIAAAVAEMRRGGVPAVAEVRLHERVRDGAARDDVRRLCAAAEHVVLIEHDRLSDDDLAVALSRLDVCVLPYRHGSHSGWLELCWDLGVPVAAPDFGHYRDQHDDDTVAMWDPAEGASSLAGALSTLWGRPTHTRPGSPQRARLIAHRRVQRAGTDAAAAARHAQLYRRLLSERTP